MSELFPDFTTSPIAFDRAKAFWERMAHREAELLGQNGEWAKWAHEDEWSDDPDMLDGAVVFTLFSAVQNKGLRVQQSKLASRQDWKPYVTSFTDVVGEGFYENPIPNLFIGAIPTVENQELLSCLVRHWFRKDVTKESMQQFLDLKLI